METRGYIKDKTKRGPRPLLVKAINSSTIFPARASTRFLGGWMGGWFGLFCSNGDGGLGEKESVGERDLSE